MQRDRAADRGVGAIPAFAVLDVEVAVEQLYKADAAVGGGTHVAFRAATRAAVERFHAAGLGAGGRDNGASGLRANYGPT